MEDRVLIASWSFRSAPLGGLRGGLENSSIDLIDGMNQILTFFELPRYFPEVSVQETLVESLADGYKLPQGLDFLLLKADELGR